MFESKQTHYDVLGVARNAKLQDITRAYNRHKSMVTRDDAAPDLKRETLIRQAYETLSDDARREAYEQSLVAPDRQNRSRMRGIVIGVLGVALAGGYLFFTRPASAPVAPIRTSEEIVNDAAISIARLQSIEMSGRIVPVGVAFAIGENVLVGSCTGVAPTAQLVVLIPPRKVPARILSVDDNLGLCRLVADGTGSKPLVASRLEARVDDLVYVTSANNDGSLAVKQSVVKRINFESGAKVIETTSAPSGAPLLNAQGQLLAVSPKADGKYIPVPAAWITEALVPFKEEKPPAPVAEPPAAANPGSPAQPDSKALQSLTPAQRDKLEKAYRPPPDTKDDWMK